AQALAPEPLAAAATESFALHAASAPSMAEADTEPRVEARLEFDALSFAPPPEPDPDLSLTLGGTPLGGDVRAGGGALILPGREASGSVSAGFARVRQAPSPDVEPPAAVETRRVPLVEPSRDVESEASAVEADGAAAPLGPRMLAGLVDVAVLAAVDAAIVLATLRATGVDLGEAERLPLAPLAVFLVLLAVGYLSMCTVLAGRTFGKAAFGLAVVEAGGRPVRLAPAIVRALIQVLTVPAAGIGFLPALLGADRRSLYDRLAGTDVVREGRAGDTRAE
ncbi:MAG: RDD family protein, partial [Vicinamibacteraceae bacterium]